MQRIKRLLFPDAPPHRPRLIAPLALLAIACSGALFAAQVGHPLAAAAAPAATAPAPAVPASPHWWNTLGHAVHIIDDASGHRREYRQWADFSGRPHESYTVDDHPAPIDAQVRQWLAIAMTPPAPPAPPPPPVVPPPPAPPRPPLPPRIENTQAYRTAVSLVEQDARVTARLGSPITSVADSCSLDSDTFECTITLSGSRGTARLQAKGQRLDGRWQYSRLEVVPEHGDVIDAARRE